ncbi:hypothetical protein TrispH2_004282 [Trichoplax sp. H2]|nr:hypothetical protein TrispH2_004282 [Trichoplax sp. H2]|eukprot:RDD43571.1 hypothetical protein TrispH2_004282 [Trichoplax sp. H2]
MPPAAGALLYNRKLGTFQDPPNPVAEKFIVVYWKNYCQLCNTMFEVTEQLITEEHHRLPQFMKKNVDKSVDHYPSEELEFLPYILLRGE